jgi:hypothetical protein
MPKQQRLPSTVAPGVPAAQRWVSMSHVHPWHSVAAGTASSRSHGSIGGFGTAVVGGFGTAVVGGFGTAVVGGFGTAVVGGFGTAVGAAVVSTGLAVVSTGAAVAFTGTAVAGTRKY